MTLGGLEGLSEAFPSCQGSALDDVRRTISSGFVPAIDAGHGALASDDMDMAVEVLGTAGARARTRRSRLPCIALLPRRASV